MKNILGLILLTATSLGYATNDKGTISSLYVGTSGELAVQFNEGFPNAIQAGECPSNNGWAGVPGTVDPAIKSALLAAKASNSTVELVISGCFNNQWLNINAVYVR